MRGRAMRGRDLSTRVTRWTRRFRPKPLQKHGGWRRWLMCLYLPGSGPLVHDPGLDFPCHVDRSASGTPTPSRSLQIEHPRRRGNRRGAPFAETACEVCVATGLVTNSGHRVSPRKGEGCHDVQTDPNIRTRRPADGHHSVNGGRADAPLGRNRHGRGWRRSGCADADEVPGSRRTGRRRVRHRVLEFSGLRRGAVRQPAERHDGTHRRPVYAGLDR